jgi:hypothetical protein
LLILAGFSDVGGYLFPCLQLTCANGSVQVQTVYDYLRQQQVNITTLWLDIENYQWTSDKPDNQRFIHDMVDRAKVQ